MNAHAAIDRPIPLRPAPQAVADAAVRSLTRAALTLALNAFDRTRYDITRHAEKTWPGDRDLSLLLKAPVSTLKLADATSYNVIAQSFLANLVPASAGAAVLARSIGLSFDGAAAISFPSLTFAPIGFVGESQPFPVVQGASPVSAQMHPAKLGVITSLTSEMLFSVNAETLVRQALSESAAAGLDAVLFDNNPAVPELRPAGLLHGVTPLTAATGTGADAMATDFVTVANALAPVSGNSPIILIMSPGQAANWKARMLTNPATVFFSAAVPAKTVIALAVNALVSSVEVPAIEAGRDSIMHMDDVAPGAVVASTPTYSMVRRHGGHHPGIRNRGRRPNFYPGLLGSVRKFPALASAYRRR